MILRYWLFCVLSGILLWPGQASAEQVLCDFARPFDLASVETHDVKLSQPGAALRIETGHKADWPGITLKAPGGRWDLSAFEYLAVDVKNIGQNRVVVHCRVDNPNADCGDSPVADDALHSVTGRVSLRPGERDTLRVFLVRETPERLRSKLFGMRGSPGNMRERGSLDTANVARLLIFVHKSAKDSLFEIADIRAAGYAESEIPADESKLFPLLDPFGQYVHKDWPGKIESPGDFAARKSEEAADLAAHPGPPDRDRYGGWKSGPQLPAGGFFRTEKRQGKWWLVDPDGRLFWSHGIDCVRPGAATTPIADRKHWFAQLPASDAPLAQFYGTSSRAPRGYYKGKQFETYDFTSANLWRKYGDGWETTFNELAQRRVQSWGLNTLGNWSSPEICALRKTPYVATVVVRSKRLAASEGYWDKFVDVFDPEFPEAARRRMAEHKGHSAGDPWCIGYFVDNELGWGDDVSLAVAALRSPADQAAKLVFIDDLKKKYGTIERLNAAWATRYASWDALLQATAAPEKAKAHDDLAAFYTKTAERYFAVCRAAVKEVAPNQLYLGCRFNWGNEQAARIAAKYCDVVSFNVYGCTVADMTLPDGIDKPVVIGEFHFGALDRGMFHPGLVPTSNQQERADAYRSFVRGALENPLIVGTHWFEFGDQPTTGRGDGENFQIGFLDVCDTPYPEIIRACRKVAQDMYHYRNDGQH